MIGIIPLLNYLNLTFRKKVCDIFPVILSTPHRESEFLRLMDPMFDFIIRETLKNYSTNEAINRIATKTLDSFIELLKYGFEDPSYMSYDVLYKKTNLILRSFFDFLKKQNRVYNRMWGSSVVLTDEMAIKYHYDYDNWNFDGHCFSITLTSSLLTLSINNDCFARIYLNEDANLFNVSDKIDTTIEFLLPDGTFTFKRLIQDKCDSLIEDFSEMEDKLLKKKPQSMKRKKRVQRKLRNSIIFH